MDTISWDKIDVMEDSEITYLLYIEGKDINTICKIRNMDKNAVENDIIRCKIKFRAVEGVKTPNEIIKNLMRYGKDERLIHLKKLDDEQIHDIESYMINNMFECSRDECSFYIWFLGEIKSKRSVQVLLTYLKCTDGNIKRLCCSALGKIGDLRAEEELINTLNTDKLQVKQYAIKALGKIKSDKAISILRSIQDNPREKDYIVNAAKMAIAHINGKGDENE